MKMYLVHNATNYGQGFQIAGIFQNKEAAIHRADYVSQFSDASCDSWTVLEVDRQKIQGAIATNNIIYTPEPTTSQSE